MACIFYSAEDKKIRVLKGENMKILRSILFICIVISTYLILYKAFAKTFINKMNSVSKAKELETSIIKKEDVRKLILSVLLGGMLFVGGIINYKKVWIAVVFLLLGMMIPTFIEYIKNKAEKKAILNDLLNMVETIKIQISAQIPLKIILRNIPELCMNKKLQVIMTDLSVSYELNTFNLEAALNELTKKIKYQEINIFASALIQHSKTGESGEAFDNLLYILKEKYIDYLEENTKVKMVLMTFAVAIVLINLALISTFPILIEVSESLSSMLV